MHPTKDLQHVSWLLTLGMMKKLILLLAFLFVSVVSAAEYHGNRQSGIYHCEMCQGSESEGFRTEPDSQCASVR